MNELAMLRGAEPRKILQTVIEEKVPAIMSYLSRGKWHVAKVLLVNLGTGTLNIQVLPKGRDPTCERRSETRTRKPHPINIQFGQPVGISLKYGYGKFIFETTVVGLEPAVPDFCEDELIPAEAGEGASSAIAAQTRTTSGGMIILEAPDRIELVQRRSYFRVNVPKPLKVNVVLWHRCKNRGSYPVNGDPPNDERHNYWQGRLVDISAGGAQIAIDAGQRANFKKGQFIGLRFTPMPYEMPLVLNAQIRDILPTADDKSICLGLQMVGLESSCEGRGVLHRLCNVVERYHQINQSGVKQQDMQFYRQPSKPSAQLIRPDGSS